MQADSTILKRFFESSHFAEFISTANWGINLVYLLLILAAFVVLILNITKLARSQGKKNDRGHALYGILMSGLCLAVLGGIGLAYVVALSFMG